MQNNLRTAFLLLVGFGVLTAVVFRPTPSELAHTAPAANGKAADALLYMWATSHVSRTLFTDPWHLFDGGIFYPARYTLAYSDHMIGQALLGLPVWLATENPLLEYNLLSLASYVLGATAMFFYARERFGNSVAALAAGVAFVFTPYRFHSPLWLQVLLTPFMPLALLFWLRFVRDLRLRDWLLWVACWVAHSLFGMYLTGLFALTMGALSITAFFLAPTRRRAALWVGSLLAPLAALLVLAPTLWPYLYLRLHQGYSRVMGLDTPLSFFLPGEGTISGQLAGLEGHAQFGPGLVVVGLVLFGTIAGWLRVRREGGWERFVWSVHATGLVVTLLMILSPIWVWLALPGLDMVRGTNRAFYITLLFSSAFLAEAISWIAGRLRSGTPAVAVAAGLLALVVVDMGTPPRERVRLPVGDELPQASRWLAELPKGEAIYEGVIGIEPVARAMYRSIFHEKPLATGYSGFMSPAAAYLHYRLHTFPSDDALLLLDAIGVRHVLWHFQDPAAVERFLAPVRGQSVKIAARFGTDVIFRTIEPPPLPPVAESVSPLPRDGWQIQASHAEENLVALIDGDATTTWRGIPGGRARVPWITVDLGRVRPVAGVRCVPPRADSPDVYFALVRLSLDGTRWESIGPRFRPDSLQALFEQPAQVRYYETRFRTHEARYVRLVNSKLAFWGWPWEIAELEILGDCEAEPIEGCSRRTGPGQVLR